VVGFGSIYLLSDVNYKFPLTTIISTVFPMVRRVRDPHHKLIQEQLNGGYFTELAEEDWQLIRPCLETNEQLFGISIDRDLLTVNGVRRAPESVYRKVSAAKLAVLAKEEVPE